VREGGVSAIAETMKAEKTFSWVAEMGSRTVINILNYHSELPTRMRREAAQAGSPTPSDLFFEAGGFQLLQELLLIFREDDMVIESVVALLSTLARFDKRNCERIAMIGGVAGVLHVMRIHEEVTEVQVECCGCLQALALNVNNKEVIAKLEGVRTVTHAMKKYPGSIELQVGAAVAVAVAPARALPFRHAVALPFRYARALPSFLPSFLRELTRPFQLPTHTYHTHTRARGAHTHARTRTHAH
jgi:predicted dinucleotide-utilizing enzyme